MVPISFRAGGRGRRVKVPESPLVKFRSSSLRQEAIPPQFFSPSSHPAHSPLPTPSHIVFTKEE